MKKRLRFSIRAFLVLTVQGLTQWLPDGLTSVSMHDANIEFKYDSHFWKYRLSAQARPLDEEQLKQWLKLGMDKFYVTVAANLVNDLGIFANVNPEIELVTHNHSLIWPLIGQMNRLKRFARLPS